MTAVTESCLARRKLLILIALSSGCMAGASAQTLSDTSGKSELVASIVAKIGPPEKVTIGHFASSGMTGIKPHALSDQELKIVSDTIAALPPLYQKMLAQHVQRISFVDGIPGVGTGLTETVDRRAKIYRLTFRTEILHQPASTWMTWKDELCFAADGSGYKIRIEAGTLGAFTYVLLHETGHVIDFVDEITAPAGIPFRESAFSKGIWAGPGELAKPFDMTLAAHTVFRGGKAYDLKAAADVYRSLASTPFVSLFGLANQAEDFSSLSAYYVISTLFHESPTIEVTNRDGDTVYSYAPSKSALVAPRFAGLRWLLQPDAKG